MIKVFSFRPEFFNNNGDQGNLEALSYFTKQPLSFVGLDEADLVLIGDGSRAAIREHEAELLAMLPLLRERYSKGLPTLIVGSAYEFYLERLPLVEQPSFGERVSEFRNVTADGISVKGYRNSELIADDLVISGSFIGTTLFGPVLAKNPWLLERIAKALNLDVQISAEEREWISKV